MSSNYQRVTVRLDPAILRGFTNLARETGFNRTAIMRNVLGDYLTAATQERKITRNLVRDHAIVKEAS